VESEALMKLLIGLSGFVIMMIGIILSIHLDFTVGLLVTFLGVFMFWAMLPSTDQNERLRRYERQHQEWLRK
jgi:Ca2+/Na+ antiporter